MALSQLLAILSLILLLTISLVLINQVVTRSLPIIVHKFINRANVHWLRFFEMGQLIPRLSRTIPILLAYFSLPILLAWKIPLGVVNTLDLTFNLAMVVNMTAVIFSIVDNVYQTYSQLEVSHRHPIKSYLQLLKLILASLAALLIIALLLGKSPWSLLAGIGAMTAVLMLVFKETLLGLMASIELAIHDMVRIGDWIEVPSHKVDGDVTDMSLTTVKIKNFDKTFSTLPIQALVNSSVKNWRGMYQEKVRRIKRSIYLDINDVRFMNHSELVKMKAKIPKLEETINVYMQHDRMITNCDLLIDYAHLYLKEHPGVVANGLTLLVRALEPSDSGLPMELYCFTKTTDWGDYEAIQSEIFNHLLATLSLFHLKSYQRSSDFKKDAQQCLEISP